MEKDLSTFIFRKASARDIDTVTEMIVAAQGRMAAVGLDQWQRGYPNRSCIQSDVEHSVGWVLCCGKDIAAYGTIMMNGEPAYDTITGGQWADNDPYAVVHRLCVAPGYLRCGCSMEFMHRAELYASHFVKSMRIDTHPDNHNMQKLIARRGFAYRGDVVIESRRLAFEKRIEY